MFAIYYVAIVFPFCCSQGPAAGAGLDAELKLRATGNSNGVSPPLRPQNPLLAPVLSFCYSQGPAAGASVDAEPKQGAAGNRNGGAAKSSYLDTKSSESEIHHYAQAVRTHVL